MESSPIYYPIDELPLVYGLMISIIAFYLVGYTFYRQSLKIIMSIVLALLTDLVGAGYVCYMYSASRQELVRIPHNQQDAMFFQWLCAFAFITLAAPCALYLYRKLVKGNLTEGEQKTGREGFVAWFRPLHVVWIVLITVTASIGFDYPFWPILVLTVGLFAVMPAWKTIGASASHQSEEKAKPDDMAADRDRVLKMLEEGKITAEESAELLGALAVSSPANRRPAPRPLTLGRKLLLIGPGLVLVGFFLPWFRIDMGREMKLAPNHVSELMQDVMIQNEKLLPGGIQRENGQPIQDLQVKGILSISGGDIHRGLGWAILLIGLGVGLIPFLGLSMDSSSLRMLALVVLGVGSLFSLYLLFGNLRYASVGLPLTLGGYVVLWIGATQRGVFET